MRWLVVILLVVAGLVALALVPHNLRAARARRAFAAFPAEERRAALDMIARAGAERRWGTLMVPTDAPSSGGLLTATHLAGEPYAEVGETWPRRSVSIDGSEDLASAPAPFLAQVRLEEPGLGAVWQGRLITVWLRDDPEPAARCHVAPDPSRHAPLTGGPSGAPAVPLASVPIPAPPQVAKDDAEAPSPCAPEALLANVPGLRPRLAARTGDPQGLLAQILAHGQYGYTLEGADVLYQGGEPELIQNPHEAVCPECAGAMRFLFQFGDTVPGVQMGDAAVCYVYGCDRHPDCVRAFVDTH
jgi:hypothetical protein